MDYAEYVPVTSTQLLALVDQNGDINLVNVREYANAEGGNTSVQDAMTGMITGDGRLRRGGQLARPDGTVGRWHDGDPDTDEVLRPVAASMTYRWSRCG